MGVKLTAGKRVRRTLEKALLVQNGQRAKWDETELVVLDVIESTTDRVEILDAIFAAETAELPLKSTRRVTEVAAEIRQCHALIAKLVATLDPKAERQKSAQHQAAANARWHAPQSSQMETVPQ